MAYPNKRPEHSPPGPSGAPWMRTRPNFALRFPLNLPNQKWNHSGPSAKLRVMTHTIWSMPCTMRWFPAYPRSAQPTFKESCRWWVFWTILWTWESSFWRKWINGYCFMDQTWWYGSVGRVAMFAPTPINSVGKAQSPSPTSNRRQKRSSCTINWTVWPS